MIYLAIAVGVLAGVLLGAVVPSLPLWVSVLAVAVWQRFRARRQA